MQPFTLWPTVLLTTALGTLGFYLLLPHRVEGRHRVVRGTGWGLVAVCLIVLCRIFLQPGTPQPDFTWRDGLDRTIFSLLAVVSLVAAAATMTSRSPENALAFFVLMILANAGLYAIASGGFVGAATVIVFGSIVVVCGWFSVWIVPRTSGSPPEPLHEPLLGCVSGSLLAAVLVGACQLGGSREVEPEAAPAADRGSIRLASGWERAPDTRPLSERDAIDWGRPHLAGLGLILFGDHWLEIPILGALLLLALVGAAVLLREPADGAPADQPAEPDNA